MACQPLSVISSLIALACHRSLSIPLTFSVSIPRTAYFLTTERLTF